MPPNDVAEAMKCTLSGQARVSGQASMAPPDEVPFERISSFIMPCSNPLTTLEWRGTAAY